MIDKSKYTLLKKYLSKNEKETKKIAKEILEILKSNNTSILLLEGDLGVGKTKFCEGILEKYNIEDQISSPTFTIVNEYEFKSENGKEEKIFHFDVYRLEDSSDFYNIGGDEFFSLGFCIIEWPERILDAIPKKHLLLTIERCNKLNENDFDIKDIKDKNYDLRILKLYIKNN